MLIPILITIWELSYYGFLFHVKRCNIFNCESPFISSKGSNVTYVTRLLGSLCASLSMSVPQGLKDGDQLTKFGSVTVENFRSLGDVAQVVQNSCNTPVQVGCALLAKHTLSCCTHILCRKNSTWKNCDLSPKKCFTVDVLVLFGPNTYKKRSQKINLCLHSTSFILVHLCMCVVQVGVVRGQERHALVLTPKQWSGRGLVGCNLVPVERIERKCCCAFMYYAFHTFHAVPCLFSFSYHLLKYPVTINASLYHG